jgi:hypothetical protein
MFAPLRVGAIVARTLSLLWNVPIVGVNHCIARNDVFVFFGFDSVCSYAFQYELYRLYEYHDHCSFRH